MAYEQILYEVKDKIATITLHRPEAMNSYTPLMCDEINAALDEADNDPNVRVVIFTGGGGTKKPVFCAGFDLNYSDNPFSYLTDYSVYEAEDTGGTNTLRLYEMKKPVIAAINGSAVGVGISMTLAMDVRICSEKSKMGFVFAKRGFVCDACSSWFLPKIVGLSKAIELAVTGRVINAQEALRIGLVTEVVPEDQVYARAVEVAKEMMTCSPMSVAMCRQMMYQANALDTPMPAHKIESVCYHYVATSPDAEEGAKAFLEKRDPDWKTNPATDMPKSYPWFNPLKFPRNIQK